MKSKLKIKFAYLVFIIFVLVILCIADMMRSVADTMHSAADKMPVRCGGKARISHCSPIWQKISFF